MTAIPMIRSFGLCGFIDPKKPMIRSQRAEDRPFPWRCGSCGQRQVYRTITPYKSTITYDGQLHDVELRDLALPTCANCGDIVFDNEAAHQIDQAFRQKLRLLQPDQILAGRTQLGLSHKDFAAQLGVSEELVLHWETGAVAQPRVADRQIRLFFELPDVRSALKRLEHGQPIGETVRAAAMPGAAAQPV